MKNKKLLAVLLAVIIAVVAVVLLVNEQTAIKFDKDFEGKQVQVDWSTLYLRNEAGDDGDIITNLHDGQVVTLTGRTQEVTLGGDHSGRWFEVETSANGTPVTGWVYADGVDLH